MSAGEQLIPDISDQTETEPVSPQIDAIPQHQQAEPQNQAPLCLQLSQANLIGTSYSDTIP